MSFDDKWNNETFDWDPFWIPKLSNKKTIDGETLQLIAIAMIFTQIGKNVYKRWDVRHYESYDDEPITQILSMGTYTLFECEIEDAPIKRSMKGVPITLKFK
jgi:hypothetical protein